MADLPYIQEAQEVKITGQDSVGTTVNYVSADANGNLFVRDYSDGPVSPGAAAPASALIGGQYNSALPTLGNTQQSAVQLDASGRLIISPLSSTTSSIAISNFPTTVDTNYGTVGANTIRTASEIGNATGGADFNAGNSSAQTLRVVVATNQSAIPVSQSGTWTTGRTWTLASGTDSVSVVQSTSPWITKDQSDGPVTPGAVASFSQLMGGQYNSSLPTLTNTQQTALQVNVNGRLLVSDSSLNVTPNGDIEVVDGLRNGGVYGNLSLSTANTSVEAKVGASRLTNRKNLTIVPYDHDMYWGYDNSVTTSTGTPLYKSQSISFSILAGSTFQVWLICANPNANARITESP